MTEALLIDKENNREQPYDSIEEAQEQAEDLRAMGAEVDVKDISTNGESDVEAEVVDHSDESGEDDKQAETHSVAVVDDAEPKPEELSKDPIGFLKSVNGDFVNNIKGKQAISKQGFRFIQREFEISTESEVVKWVDDPLGCIVWAKAELPSGYSAEAHGEGYQFEGDVSDNEFVRYADTRAKNRAISDLTSAGALAVSELGGSNE